MPLPSANERSALKKDYEDLMALRRESAKKSVATKIANEGKRMDDLAAAFKTKANAELPEAIRHAISEGRNYCTICLDEHVRVAEAEIIVNSFIYDIRADGYSMKYHTWIDMIEESGWVDPDGGRERGPGMIRTISRRGMKVTWK